MGALSILQLALLPSLACAFATPAAGPRASPFSLQLSSNDNDALPPSAPPDVLCVGETLWDSLPSGIYLGGAPSNVAVHLASLFASSSPSNGEAARTVAIAACVGDDQLGKEAVRRLALKGVRTDYVQSHPDWDTGMATAIIGGKGDATYEFITPAAWDGLGMDDQLSETLGLYGDGEQGKNTRVCVMGTIAARLGSEHGATSASTLKTIRNTAPEGTVVLDVNLRSPWYAPGEVLGLIRGDEPARKLALLKLNEEELPLLERWCGLDQSTPDAGGEGDSLQGSILERRMDQLASSLNTERVCVTRGSDGAALLCKDDSSHLFCEHDGHSLATSNDSDTVGAGDAFLAVLVNSLFICNESPKRALERACALGGYVAGCRGATPEHGDAPEGLRRIFSDVI